MLSISVSFGGCGEHLVAPVEGVREGEGKKEEKGGRRRDASGELVGERKWEKEYVFWKRGVGEGR